MLPVIQLLLGQSGRTRWPRANHSWPFPLGARRNTTLGGVGVGVCRGWGGGLQTGPQHPVKVILGQMKKKTTLSELDEQMLPA